MGFFWFFVCLLFCFLFFFFIKFLSGNLRALTIRAEAEDPTSIWACLLCLVSFTVIPRPFQSLGALVICPPTFLGNRLRGLILGADVAPACPPMHLSWFGWGRTGAADVVWTWVRMTKESCTLASSKSWKPKAPTLFILFVDCIHRDACGVVSPRGGFSIP